MKKRNLLLILFVLALPLVILYFLAEIEEMDKEESGDRSREAESEKSKIENRKSKSTGRQESVGRSQSFRNAKHESRITEKQKAENREQKIDGSKLTDRQSEIFDFIKENKEVKMTELRSSFKDVTERTLRRDLAKLQELKLINKKGATKSSVYFLQ